MVGQSMGMDARRIAKHFGWSVSKAQAAINYAAAFPKEIAAAIRDFDAMDLDAIRGLVPNVEVFSVGLDQTGHDGPRWQG